MVCEEKHKEDSWWAVWKLKTQAGVKGHTGQNKAPHPELHPFLPEETEEKRRDCWDPCLWWVQFYASYSSAFSLGNTEVAQEMPHDTRKTAGMLWEEKTKNPGWANFFRNNEVTHQDPGFDQKMKRCIHQLVIINKKRLDLLCLGLISVTLQTQLFSTVHLACNWLRSLSRTGTRNKSTISYSMLKDLPLFSVCTSQRKIVLFKIDRALLVES